MVYTILMTLLEGGEMSRMPWGKVIAQQLMLFTIVINKMMHNCEWLFLLAALL